MYVKSCIHVNYCYVWYAGGMSYEVGTHIPLDKVNEPSGSTFQDAVQKEIYDVTFETIGQTIKAVRHIPVLAL